MIKACNFSCILLIGVALMSCSKWDVANQSLSYPSYGDISIYKKGTELLLVFPVQKLGNEGPFLFRMQSHHVRRSTPDICFEYTKKNGEHFLLYSAPVLNSKDTIDYILPPLINDYESIQASISIEESSIVFDFLSFEEYSPKVISDSGVVFHAHLGYKPFTPENTLPSFDYCGKSSFRACVVTPIESSDGVIFCYHEDNQCLSENGGHTIIGLSSNEFHALTSSEILSRYDAGVYKGIEWKNTPICTIDDFIATCSKYNMAPTFSTHPMLSETGWVLLKEKLEEYKLTNRSTIKAFSISVLKKAYSIFGEDIHQYVYDAPLQPIEDTLDALSKVSFKDSLIGIELPLYFWDENMVRSVTSAGRIASAYSIGYDGKDIRRLVKWGVSEFTSDSFIMFSNWMSL